MVHGDRYDYSAVEYVRADDPVSIVCRTHGPFRQTPAHHANGGQGCPACAAAERGLARRTAAAEDFIARARAVHGARYDYAQTLYTHALGTVSIICPKHGGFTQKAGAHVAGSGCPACGRETSAPGFFTQADFAARARAVHGDRYDYSIDDYSRLTERVTIHCREHGPFQQIANNHLIGHGCPRCGKFGPSPSERDLLAFVQSLKSDAYGSDRKLIAPKELDIVVPSARIAIELNGVYWHSDRRSSKTAGRDKRTAVAAAGYRLLAVTCAEWKERRPQFERLIRNALGCSQDAKLHARQCAIVEPTTAETIAFLDAYHPQQPGRVYTRRFGLQHPVHGLVAVMTFNLDAYSRNRTKSGVWDLTRFATSAQVRGGASKLFKHAVAVLCAQSVVSYSAHDWFAGGVYEALGFTATKEVEPDYRVYHRKLGFRPKSAWARKHIPTRLLQIGSSAAFDPANDSRTEWDIEDAVGALRVWDSGKTLWTWRKTNPA
ncbi:homing endonuclease [Xanthomonas phage NEB7]|nr:homing endonuclease [Xanthomonas phage NEB7]